MQKSHTLSITQLFFIAAKLFWGMSSQRERVAEVRSAQTAEQTAHALEITARFVSSHKPHNCKVY